MVAIKDMEMPNNCIECKLCHFFFDLNGVTHFICKCGNMEMCGNIENKRNDLCPLIEVDKTEIYKDCFQPKTGYCKECKYFEYDSAVMVDGFPLIVAHEICNKWGDGCKTKEDGYCFLFEPLVEKAESEDK